jgi:hypothetical protein
MASCPLPPVIAVLAATLAFGGANDVRQGRRTQVDGFLLEWDAAAARPWPGSAWKWDAVSAPDGVAGYASLDNKVCPEWTLAIRAANTGKGFSMRIPGPPSGDFFAFDKALFDSAGAIAAEWAAPWEFFDDGGDADVYEMTISAVSACGDTLQPLTLSIKDPKSPAAPNSLLTKAVMVVLIAALTVVLAAIRRKRINRRATP